jgi:hypothetical protein
MIDYLRGIENDVASAFQYVLDQNIPFGITSLIYQEALQVVKTERDFKNVKKYLDTQRFYELKDKKESFAAAAMIYFIHSVISFCAYCVIPACRESFFPEGCRTSRHDRRFDNRILCAII